MSGMSQEELVKRARWLRLARVKQYFLLGALDRETAVILLSGELSPGDGLTVVDDSALLDATFEQTKAVLGEIENVADRVAARAMFGGEDPDAAEAGEPKSS